MLEKTLESPLDCKEIQPVNPKRNQSWVFIRRTDAETEALILWPPDASVSSVQFSCSVVSDSLRPHESQHASPPCPSPTSGVHSDSTCIESVMPSSHLILCHPLLLPPSIFPSTGSFQMSQLFASAGQSSRVSASTTVLPIQD